MPPSNSTKVLLASLNFKYDSRLSPHPTCSAQFISSTITTALDGYCPKVFSRKEEAKKWRGKIMVLRNKVDKGTTEIWVKEIK
jgi:hypothetical protein